MLQLNALKRLPVILVICCVSSVAAAQNLRESARRHAARYPGESLPLVGPLGDYWPKPIEEVAREAVVVVRAKLTLIDSYLSASEDRVLTDYAMMGPAVIAGTLPSREAKKPGETAALVLTRYGGKITTEGVQISAYDSQFEPIEDGAEYLLFLRQGRPAEPGRFGIHYGGIFEIRANRVTPLLKNADLIFKGTVDERVDDFIARIRAAVQRHP